VNKFTRHVNKLPPFFCSTSLLQALEVLPRLEQVRPLPCFPPLC